MKIDELDLLFEMDELNKSLSELKSNKASGSDNLINEFFINASSDVKTFILKLFNVILSTEIWPSKWSEGIITPVFKKGDINDSANYRAIVLISSLAKILTSMLNRRLVNWAKKYEKITDRQFGFQKGKSTIDCIFILQSLIQMSFARGKTIYCCFVDYSRAFDSVNHDALWHKINKLGISSKIVNILRNMYSKIRLSVKSDLLSKELRESDNLFFKPLAGVLQGEIISSFFILNIH